MVTNDPKAKILVIDDDPDFLKVVSMMLESGPYTVVTAKDPKEGKEKLFAEKPDLILLDIMMDSLFDGYSLCNDIKTSQEYEEFKEIPIIFCSAVKEIAGSRFDFGTEQQGLTGPDDYIDKPVQSEDLFARIEKLLKK
jgi:CheY-like chemotaxis protein